ncbi:hypothetical protein Hanom_Chr14g01250781 [Helianthus anomalus]
MSSAPRSASKSTSKFNLDDIESIISPRSIKRELARCQSQSEPKVVSTRAKIGSEREKPSDPEEDSFQIKRQFHDFVTERFVRLKALQDKSLEDAEEKLADLRSIVAAKDKKIAQLE